MAIIEGTIEGNIGEAIQVHVDCIELVYKKRPFANSSTLNTRDILYQVLPEENVLGKLDKITEKSEEKK